jgi:drug/metabolite transporter (DMT)-like permease
MHAKDNVIMENLQKFVSNVSHIIPFCFVLFCWQCLAVAFAIGGVVIVSLYHSEGDDSKVHDNKIGYVLVIISTMMYSLYEVLAQSNFPDTESKYDQLVGSTLFMVSQNINSFSLK